jgi:hypothetical protein
MPPPPTVSAPPTVTVPPPKDVPWWGALILAVVTAVVSVIGTVLFLRGKAPEPGGPPGFGLVVTDSITFLPHILILFGILADIFTLQGAYSIPSLVGLASLPLHYVMQFLWAGVAVFLSDIYKLATTAPPKAPSAPLFTGSNTGASVGNAPRKGGAMSAWNGCEVYGFNSLVSPYAPQGLVVTSTIFWYYLLDLLMNRNILDSVATFVAFPLFFGLQVMQLATCDNFADSVLIKSFIALAEGFIIGGTGYGIVQSYIPERLPSSLLPSGPSLSSMTKNADGSYTDKDGKIYVVGPDGKPIPQSFFTDAAKSSAAAKADAVALFGAAAINSCSTSAAAPAGTTAA